MAHAWSREEDEIVRELYPTMGAKMTAQALASKHYVRTVGATKERAKNLGIKRDMSTMRRTVDNAWTEREIEVLRRGYEEGGAAGARRALESIGSSRTIGAINARAHILGILTPKGRRRTDKGGGETVIRNISLDKELDGDIIDKLDSVHNRSHYVRELVRQDLKK